MKEARPRQNHHHRRRGNGKKGGESIPDESHAKTESSGESTPVTPSEAPPVASKEGLLRSVLGLKIGGPVSPPPVESGRATQPALSAPPGIVSTASTAKPQSASSAPPGLFPAAGSLNKPSAPTPAAVSLNSLPRAPPALVVDQFPTGSGAAAGRAMPALVAPNTGSLPPGLQPQRASISAVSPPLAPPSGSSATGLTAFLNQSEGRQFASMTPMDIIDSASGDYGLALSTMRALNIDDSNTQARVPAAIAMPIHPPAASPTKSSPVVPASPSSTSATADRQKTAALLSVMKSRVGDITVKRGSPAAATDVLAEVPPPIVAEKRPEETAEGAAAAAAAAAAKKVLTYRIVKNQVAQLLVKVRNFKTKEDNFVAPGYYFRPGNGMTVEWRIPASLAEKYIAAPNNRQRGGAAAHEDNTGDDSQSSKPQEPPKLVIGLLRYGTANNAGCLVTKTLQITPKALVTHPHTGERFYTGDMPFFAPKSAGQFVYRLFDPTTKESVFDTLGTSALYHVVLIDQDIAQNFPAVMDSFDKEQNFTKGIAQFSQLVRGMKSCSAEHAQAIVPPLNRCLERVIDEIQRTMSILEEGYEKKKTTAAANAVPAPTAVGINEAAEVDAAATTTAAATATAAAPAPKDDDGDFWTSYRQAAKMHLDAYDALLLLLEKRAVWYFVSEKLKHTVLYLVHRQFCPILRRFFPAVSDMTRTRLDHLQFHPAPAGAGATAVVLSPAVRAGIEQSMVAVLTKLMPSADFLQRRESMRENLQRQLQRAGILPDGSVLALYGSSANNFGKDDSDMDMCLVLPSDHAPKSSTAGTAAGGHSPTPAEAKDTQHTAERLLLLEKIAETLMAMGMTNVSARLTARIPIVEYHDPLTQLDGDISLHNPLALANTRMLRTYVDIDPRVRYLAFLIKHWAKSRHINSPQDGTLSSYGFILSLIYFLQMRPVPVLPNLQLLPPDWSGQRYHQPSPHGPPVNAAGGRPSTVPLPSLPQVMATSVDGTRCNVYFLEPNGQQMRLLQQMASENTESPAQLLVEYFRFYAWTFDVRHDVVSIRRAYSSTLPYPPSTVANGVAGAAAAAAPAGPVVPPSVVQKLDKYEESAWFHTDVLSIEDPFETAYDVAHVLRAAQMSYLRKEFLRAYTLACRTVPPAQEPAASPNGLLASLGLASVPAAPVAPVDALPNYVAPNTLIEALCEPCEPPPFVGRRKASLSITDVAAFGSATLSALAAAAGSAAVDALTTKDAATEAR